MSFLFNFYRSSQSRITVYGSDWLLTDCSHSRFLSEDCTYHLKRVHEIMYILLQGWNFHEISLDFCFSKLHLKKNIIFTNFHDKLQKFSSLRKFSYISRQIFPFPWSTISHKYFRLAVITGGDRSDVTTSSLTPTGCLKDRKRERKREVVRLTTNLLEEDRGRKIESKFGTPTLCRWGSILGYTCTRRGDPTGRKHRTP